MDVTTPGGYELAIYISKKEERKKVFRIGRREREREEERTSTVPSEYRGRFRTVYWFCLR